MKRQIVIVFMYSLIFIHAMQQYEENEYDELISEPTVLPSDLSTDDHSESYKLPNEYSDLTNDNAQNDPDLSISYIPKGLVVLYSSRQPICTGTIIQRLWIITAASCLEQVTTVNKRGVRFNMRFVIKASNNGQQEEYKPISLQFHPSYDPTSNNYNIILIKVDRPLENAFELYGVHESTNTSLSEQCTLLSLDVDETSRQRSLSSIILPDTCAKLMMQKMSEIHRAPNLLRALGYNNLCLLPPESKTTAEKFCTLRTGSAIFCSPMFQKVQGIAVTSPLYDVNNCAESPIPFLFSTNELFWIFKAIEHTEEVTVAHQQMYRTAKANLGPFYSSWLLRILFISTLYV